jgi:PAS domain S-box-containing protein
VISALCDAHATREINDLLNRAIQVITAAFPADHVLIQDLDAIDTSSRFFSCSGWDKATAARLANTLVELSQQPGCAELEDITPEPGQMQGSIYIPSSAILEEYGLAAGTFVTVPCVDGRLAVFAGSSGSGSAIAVSGAVTLRAIMNMLSLGFECEYEKLANSRNLQQLVQAKHQWESTLDALPQLMCLIDENGHVIRTNRTLETWGLGDVTLVRGKLVHDVIHPDCRDWSCTLKTKFEDMWQQLVNTEFVECDHHDSTTGRELRFSLCQGRTSQYHDANEEEGYAFLVIEDVSQKKTAERMLADYNEELERQLQERTIEYMKANAALKGEIEDHLLDGSALVESEKKYTCLVETTLAGLYIIRDDRVSFCNNRFAEIFGYSKDEIDGLKMQQLFPTTESESGEGLNDRVQDTRWMSDERIVKGITRDGKDLWLQRNLTRVDCLNRPMIMGNIIDITEQKNTEDALRLSQRELQILSGQLLEAQEAERKRIAAELHDSVGQSISAIKFGMENAMREYESSLPQSGRQCMRGVIGKLRDTIDEVRNIAMNLRPSMLDDLGLKVTIKWFVREFITVFPSISVDSRIDIAESDLSDLQKIVIFRIIQESLNNIGKHADAVNVSIELRNIDGGLALSVKDDGKGFLPGTLYAGQGFGLSSMRDRVKLTDGEFAIESSPGAGTHVRAAWPGIVEQ